MPLSLKQGEDTKISRIYDNMENDSRINNDGQKLLILTVNLSSD